MDDPTKMARDRARAESLLRHIARKKCGVTVEILMSAYIAGWVECERGAVVGA